MEDLKQLLGTFVERLCTVLGVAQGAIFLKGETGKFEVAEAKSPQNIPQILEPDARSLRLLEIGESMVKSRDKTLTWFIPMNLSSSTNTETAEGDQRIQNSTKLIGILVLGPRAGGIGYSSEERVLVMGLADQVAASIRLLSTSSSTT